MARLDFDEYERAASLAQSVGFAFIESDYDEQFFGSWWIILSKAGNLFRIVFDNREDWLVLQRQGGNDWSELWIGRQPSEKSVDELIARLVEAP